MTSSKVSRLKRETRALADPAKARLLRGFFKTGKGHYGEGDVFYGIMVPRSRKIARCFDDLSADEIAELLRSKIHEERFIALVILTRQYERGDAATKRRIYDFYLSHTHGINNWDLVDVFAPKIVGDHLRDRPKGILTKLARSRNLWERRIAIVASMAFIRDGDVDTTFRLARMLFGDRHDLLHKATGWALREAFKKDPKKTRAFLRANAARMPRTALRSAIERMPERERKAFLAI